MNAFLYPSHQLCCYQIHILPYTLHLQPVVLIGWGGKSISLGTKLEPTFLIVCACPP